MRGTWPRCGLSSSLPQPTAGSRLQRGVRRSRCGHTDQRSICSGRTCRCGREHGHKWTLASGAASIRSTNTCSRLALHPAAASGLCTARVRRSPPYSADLHSERASRGHLTDTLWQGNILFSDPEYLAMFHDSYHAAIRHCKHGHWYVDVHMSTAQARLSVLTLTPHTAAFSQKLLCLHSMASGDRFSRAHLSMRIDWPRSTITKRLSTGDVATIQFFARLLAGHANAGGRA